MNSKQIIAILGSALTGVGYTLKEQVNTPVAYWIGVVLVPLGLAVLGGGAAMKHSNR